MPWLLQPIAFGVSCIITHENIILDAMIITAYCIWSVIQFNSPISIWLVLFQRNVVKET